MTLLARTCTRTPDQEELVERYYGLAGNLAARYSGRGVQFDDLFQVACIGLLKAVDRFDPGHGARFLSFAVPTIVGELKRHFRDESWAVRIPRRLGDNAMNVRAVKAELVQQFGRFPDVAETAAHCGLSEDEVVEADQALGAYAGASLDALREGDQPDAVPAQLVDEGLEALELTESWVDLVPHIKELPQRQRYVLYLRFFKGWTQSRIAAELDISQVHVSRLTSQALERLRRALLVAEEAG